MTHFHVIPAKDIEWPIASLRFDTYSEAIDTFVALTNMMLGHIITETGTKADFSLEKAVAATEAGYSGGAFAGTDCLGFYFLTCYDEDEPCASFTWN